MHIVILAGGSGTRLWPLSRKAFPKQFLTIVTEHQSMLQATVARVEDKDKSIKYTVICNEEHRFIAAQQMKEMGVQADIILEPVGRNTAPAIALAALKATEGGDDPLLLVLSADHYFADAEAFRDTLAAATDSADNGNLVTFGVVPDSPATGYGYIKRQVGTLRNGAYGIEQFVEKPGLEDAKRYVESGEYYWNSGIFLFHAKRYLAELSQYRPDILAACEDALETSEKDQDFVRISAEKFSQCPSESIDYALMEHTSLGAVVPLDAGWSDIGSWSSLLSVSKREGDGNRLIGDVLNIDTKNSLVYSTSRLVTTVGLDGIVAVETPDAVLIADIERDQEVKELVATLRTQGRSEAHMNREVYRPWGKYDAIAAGERYQVKRITVNPGAKLSVQMHHHRAEHWIVVSGTARVSNGDTELLLTENQSTYIPVGIVHALENPGKIPLEMIEVQSGSYLGEDDIVRLEDRYGRV